MSRFATMAPMEGCEVIPDMESTATWSGSLRQKMRKWMKLYLCNLLHRQCRHQPQHKLAWRPLQRLRCRECECGSGGRDIFAFLYFSKPIWDVGQWWLLMQSCKKIRLKVLIVAPGSPNVNPYLIASIKIRDEWGFNNPAMSLMHRMWVPALTSSSVRLR